MTYRNRHECKFVVPESVAGHVLRRVMPYVAPDQHAAKRPDHSYSIASLYLDDDRRSLYRETVEGMASRYKLRVRAYEDKPTAPVFLEVKRRHDRVVQKLRVAIPRQLLAAVLAGDAELVKLPNASPRQLAALAEFSRLLHLRRATPCATVRYQRQAYVGLEDQEVRVTIDRRLCVLPEHEPIVRVNDPGFVTVPTSGVILELKFTDRCPPWMVETMRVCDLRRRSFSKYCNALDALAARRTASL